MAAPTRFRKGTMPNPVCDVCGKSFCSKSSLSRHHKGLHQQKVIKCGICNKASGLRDALREHLISHEDDAINTCSVCGKSYKHRQSLRRHMKEHIRRPQTTESSTSRPAEKKTCQNCNKEFLHLSKHQKICGTERKRDQVCPVCNRKFLQKRYLQEHIRCVHSCEELFKYKTCDS